MCQTNNNSTDRRTIPITPALILTSAVGLIVAAANCQTSVNVPAAGAGDTVSFANDIQPIFTQQCISCHVIGGFADQQGIPLRLTDGNAFDQLVNQPSVQDSSLILATPGDSANSLLFLKVSSDMPPVGARMPLIGEPLPSADLALIRDWIDQGAMNN